MVTREQPFLRPFIPYQPDGKPVGPPGVTYYYVPLSPNGMAQPMSIGDFYKQKTVNLLADKFCKATVEQIGADEQEMKKTLRQVTRLGLQREFDEEVRRLAWEKENKIVNGAADVVESELGGNTINRFFRGAPLQECRDIMRTGRNPYHVTPWQYRRYGMYRSVADFVDMCKKHPFISFPVIGAVAYLGDKFPYLGAASGLALMAWSVGASAVHEFQVRHHRGMDATTAAHYEQSGENMAAFLMTIPGIHGIDEGVRAGRGAFKQVFSDSVNWKNFLPKSLTGLKKATTLAKNSPEYTTAVQLGKSPERLEKEKNKKPDHWIVRVIKRGLFVTGLFDNVLLPFNWVADQMDDD
jgi:hypothetical protein